jgi:outer membrane biosynthesis protein TonB
MRLCALALALSFAACQSSQSATRPGAAEPAGSPAAAAPESASPGTAAAARGFATSCDGADEGHALILTVDTTVFPHTAYLENVVYQIARRLPAQSPADSLTAKAVFVVQGDGSLSELRLDTPSGNAAFDSATVRAIAAAGHAGAFGALPETFARDSLWLTLERRQAAGGQDERYFLEQPPKLAKNLPLPAQPPYRTADTGGRVRVRFVVDTTGWADVHSFKVIEASDIELVGVMRHVVGRARFTPAEIAGCKVRREMQMGFEFQPARGE